MLVCPSWDPFSQQQQEPALHDITSIYTGMDRRPGSELNWGFSAKPVGGTGAFRRSGSTLHAFQVPTKRRLSAAFGPPTSLLLDIHTYDQRWKKEVHIVQRWTKEGNKCPKKASLSLSGTVVSFQLAGRFHQMRKSSSTVLWSIDKGPRWHEWDRRRHLLSSWLLIFKEDASFEMFHQRWSDSILRLKCMMYFSTSYPQPFSFFGKKHDWNCLILFATANSDQNITTVPVFLDYWIFYYLW